MKTPKEIIKVGQIELRFLFDGDDSNNQMVMFEMLIPVGAKVPVPHYHVSVDEAIYGLEGVLSSIIDGKTIETRPGESCFIPRGAVHYHDNSSTEPARSLVVLSPASIGPAYFREIRDIMIPGVPPDQKKAGEIMEKHGLIPVVNKAN